jgi:hypothetical protein
MGEEGGSEDRGREDGHGLLQAALAFTMAGERQAEA